MALMTDEATRNARGQLLVTFPEWLDISTVGERAGVSRYHGYLIIKGTPSCQRVEFTNHPSPQTRIDLAATRQDADAAIGVYQDKERAKQERKTAQDKQRVEARKALPEKRRQIAEARDARNVAKRELSRLLAGQKNEVAKRRSARRSVHNAALREAVDDMNASRDNAQKTFKEQGEELAQFYEVEIETIQAEYERELASLKVALDEDIDEMDDEVEAENATRVKVLETTIAEQQTIIERLI